MKLPSISLGFNSKRNFFDLSHDFNSTSDFGFCQPTLVQSCMKGAKYKLNTKSVVRLAPLPVPTFARVKVETYNRFVPMVDVFEGFNHLQAQMSIGTSRGTSYIPQTADFLYSGDLFGLCATNSNTENPLRGLFTYSISGNFDLHSGEGREFHNLNEDIKSSQDWQDIVKGFVALKKNIEVFASSTSTKLAESSQSLRGDYVPSLSTSPHVWLNNWEAISGIFNDSLPIDIKQLRDWYNNLTNESKILLNSGRSFENADFYYTIGDGSTNIKYYTAGTTINPTENNYPCQIIVGLHLTPRGKRLFKIFNTLGYNFKYNKKLEVNKLFAYYKAWFDTFNPGRVKQWKETYCYMLIHYFYDYAYTLADCFHDDEGLYYHHNQANLFILFLNELTECCYTLAVDPITVATPKPVQYSMTNHYMTTLYQNDDDSLGYSSATSSNSSTTVYGDVTADPEFGGLYLKWLEKIYNLVNKNSVIGKKIDDYLKAHNITTKTEDSYNLGKSDYMIPISDIFGVVNNEQTTLGEYAGKGLGNGDVKCEIEAPEFGYLIQFVTIVPFGGYVQASTPGQFARCDFYQAEFDSMGMDALPMSQVFDRESNIGKMSVSDKTFGFVPRYFNLKYKNNVANGGFSFRSERSQFLPYSLDRLFTESELYTSNNSNSRDHLQVLDSVTLTPDESLRYIGNNENYGNYDRIFYDTTGFTDNFIIHMVHDFSMVAPMKSISDSYDTFDKEDDNSTTNVEHS